MKANELMIGDWARIWNYAPEIYTQEFVQISLDDFLSEYDRIGGFDEYEPIPLTPEILDKNGFVYEYRPEPYLSVYERDCILLTKASSDAFPRLRIGIRWFTLQYVHELQHALRLCGLTELANNFKIE